MPLNFTSIVGRPENRDIILPSEEIEGTMHAKPGSAEVLMIRMYQIFTGNQIKTLRGEYSLDFT